VKIAVASGKGGTGKTTVATSLFKSISDIKRTKNDAEMVFLDCDVEAPNAHLFLTPEIKDKQEVSIKIPSVDEAKCTHCGLCAEVCQFNAIAVIGKKVLVFPQLCHGCGSCALMCPEKAISEVKNTIGYTESGKVFSDIDFAHGYLNIGEPMAIPVISNVKSKLDDHKNGIAVLDASPGTSCPVVETIRDTDFVLLVTEPTPFGLHDLKLAFEVAKILKVPAAVVINRSNIGDNSVQEFCDSNDIPVLMSIPYEKRIAEGIAVGKLLIDIVPEYKEKFENIFLHISNVIDNNEGQV